MTVQKTFLTCSKCTIRVLTVSNEPGLYKLFQMNLIILTCTKPVYCSTCSKYTNPV